MKVSGAIKDFSLDYKSGKAVLSLTINEKQSAMMLFDELNTVDKLSIDIDKYREKRSLNANNYAWKLITEIGNATLRSKEEVYLEMLREYGQSELVSVLASIDVKGYFKYYDEAWESSLKGKLFKHYKVYKGSSEFDTREMSIFIDGIVYEAEELGIQTMTPNEIARLKAAWG